MGAGGLVYLFCGKLGGNMTPRIGVGLFTFFMNSFSPPGERGDVKLDPKTAEWKKMLTLGQKSER